VAVVAEAHAFPRGKVLVEASTVMLMAPTVSEPTMQARALKGR
jgi:hypothetical protein